MLRLTPPTIDAHRAFLDIAGSKREDRKKRLLSMAGTIRDHYDNYETNRHDLSVMVPAAFAITQRADLLDCYTGQTTALDRLKVAIRTSQPQRIRNVCQYCGIGSTSDTFDHYLPKEQYPEFAVFALNLLPCCTTCNRYKGEAFLMDGVRTIVNLYFDPLPTERYLFADVDFDGNLPLATFRIEQHPGMDPDLYQRMKAHFTKLRLLQRFRDGSDAQYSEAKSSARAYCDPVTPEEVRAHLAKEAQRLARDYFSNYWRAVLFEALAANAEFVERCCVPDGSEVG